MCQLDRIKAKPPLFAFPRACLENTGHVPADAMSPSRFLSRSSLLATDSIDGIAGRAVPRFPVSSPSPPQHRSLVAPTPRHERLPRLPFRYRPPREACSESRKRSITFYGRIVSHVPSSWSPILTTRNWVA